ncbi:GNAT family N-acetyltransferase [Actinoplanes teichomyceticus]|uniref:GNAT family N-acetyltransferase n=1 Tax=Actinoplanes teichomyceticus TaxID=1867 RepID=UPI0013DE73D2|nr:GNAT family N-acetyltransferase [Actinoplanes teichomyceticus]
MTELGRRHTEPGTWIKAATNPSDLHRVLPARWAMSDTGYLMTVPFTGGDPVVPAPYSTQLEVEGDVIVASVLDTAGRTAARGRLAPAGRVGVIDQVETAPTHRRRGLASAVMRTLAHHAVRRGMHRGVLVATDDGRELYRTLGWTVRSPIAAAHIPEAPTPLA